MGVRQVYLEYLESKGVIDVPGARILDVGAQNAYLFQKEYVIDFVKRRGTYQAGTDEMAERFARGGDFDPQVNGFRNDSFLNDLFRMANIEYTSIDVFERPDNIVVDLNEFRAPPWMRGAYSTVLNFGTTEHVFDQRNCFQVIHDCATVGGYMFHQVPAVGCVDHSFFLYSPVFFGSIASCNDYEMVDLWFSGPYGGNSAFSTLKSQLYAGIMPDRDSFRDRGLPDNFVDGWNTKPFPDGTINALMRKKTDKPFRLPFELSTAIGEMVAPNAETHRPKSDLDAISDDHLLAEVRRRGLMLA